MAHQARLQPGTRRATPCRYSPWGRSRHRILGNMNSGIREPANAAHPAQSNELLGLPGDARVLIINADDFGMYPAVNAAVIREGLARARTPQAAAAGPSGRRSPVPGQFPPGHRRQARPLRHAAARPSGRPERVGGAPALGDEQSQMIDPGWRVRRTDYDFLISPQATALLDNERIVVIDYRMIQWAWSGSPGR